MRSCSQIRTGICSQTRPGISLCSLSGLCLQGKGQFLVVLNQSRQSRASLCTFPGLSPPDRPHSLVSWFSLSQVLLFYKIIFPGPVRALRIINLSLIMIVGYDFGLFNITTVGLNFRLSKQNLYCGP